MRADLLVDRLDRAGVDAVLVTDLTNIRYLTGFTGSSAIALIGTAQRTFVSDFRYAEQSAQEVPAAFERLIVTRDPLSALAQALSPAVSRLGFEDGHTSVKAFGELEDQLGDRATLVPVGSLVEDLRLVKDQREVEAIARAAQIADAALSALLAAGVGGRSERELALALEHDMRLRGAESPSFPTIVAHGAHGALPHAAPRDVAVQRGCLITFDWGAVFDGYCSDCTRTYAVGEPSAHAREIYELVRATQARGVELIRPGADARAVDRETRDMIDGAGHREHYGHGLGHGVGLEVHESPTLSIRSVDTLAAGNVLTVEPGVYIPGELGVRIEDLVLVAGEGRPGRVLSSLPKDLLTID